ncbi:hypothetical protein D9M68_510130 [compost metagenome]
MRDLFAEHRVVDIGMGVDMDERHRSVFLGNRLQDRIADRVISAERQRNAVMLEDLADVAGDDLHVGRQVEGVDGDVADIGDLQTFEGCCPRRHVVGTDHHRLGADLPWPVARAGAVGRADIHGDPNEARIEAFSRRRGGKAHHRAWATEAGHVVAAQRLIEFLIHRSSPF